MTHHRVAIKTFQHQLSQAFGFSVSIWGQQSSTGPKKEHSARALTLSCGWAEGGGRRSQNMRILLVHWDCEKSRTISLFRPHFSFKCEIQIHGTNKWDTGGRGGFHLLMLQCGHVRLPLTAILENEENKGGGDNLIFSSVAKKTNYQREQLK